MICHNNKCLYIDLLHFSTLYRSNHVPSFIRDLARHFMLLDTVSNALARCMAPAPTSGYLAKKHSISSKLVCVANVFVIDGINEVRCRSFRVYLSTRNSQLERTHSQTNGVPTGFSDMAIKQPRKSWTATYFSSVAVTMNLRRKYKKKIQCKSLLHFYKFILLEYHNLKFISIYLCSLFKFIFLYFLNFQFSNKNKTCRVKFVKEYFQIFKAIFKRSKRVTVPKSKCP